MLRTSQCPLVPLVLLRFLKNIHFFIPTKNLIKGLMSSWYLCLIHIGDKCQKKLLFFISPIIKVSSPTHYRCKHSLAPKNVEAIQVFVLFL